MDNQDKNQEPEPEQEQEQQQETEPDSVENKDPDSNPATTDSCKNTTLNSTDTLKIVNSAELGRFVLAEKDFLPRDVILEELPLVTAPSGQTDLNAETKQSFMVCIGCYLSLKETKDQVYFCPQCQWPFCSESCASQNDSHSKMECKIFKEKNIEQDVETIRLVYFIRCLCLQTSDPNRWNKILDLTAAYDGGKSKTVTDKDLMLHFDVSTTCGLQVSTETIANLNGIRSVNAFQINYCELEDKRYYGMALYNLGCIISHACNPNARWRTLMPEKMVGYPMRVQANDHIRQGTPVTIAYRNKCLTTGILRRREELLSGHGFLCRCDRCGDATEFGTHFSAMRCTNCEPGYLLPQQPYEPQSDWICKICNHSEKVVFVKEICEKITLQIQKAKELKCKSNEICCKLDVIINKYSGKVLHPNNYLIIWAEFLWLQFLEYNIFTMKSTTLKYELFLLMTKRARHVCDIYSKFFSAYSRFYGYFEKLIGFAHYLHYLTPKIWDDMGDKQRLRTMRTTLEHFEKSLQYDGWDSDELTFIETKLNHIKRIVNTILKRMGHPSAHLVDGYDLRY